MLSQCQRTTILELNTQGVSKRQIARVLGISRLSVRKVLRSNSPQVPELSRPEKAEPYRQQILELFASCKGNLVRVHEELAASGAHLSYSGPDRLLPPAWHRASAPRAGGPVPLRARRGDAARHFSARVELGGQEAQGANRLGRAVLLAHVVLPVLPDLSAFRLQGVSHRRPALLRRVPRAA